MIYCIGTVAGIILLAMLSVFTTEDSENKFVVLEKTAVFSTVYFSMLYCLFSVFLFAIRAFSVGRTLVLVDLAIVLTFAIKLFLNKEQKVCFNKITINTEIKENFFPYLAIIFCLIISAGGYGFFGMGQDQGVYQTEAINLYYGDNSWFGHIEEYDNLVDGEYKEYFSSLLSGMLGRDQFMSWTEPDTSFLIDSKTATAGDGIWHGIPAYAALLALWSRMFGISNMMGLQAILYASLLLIFVWLLKKESINSWITAIAVLLLGMCPQIIFVKKSTLTEMFFAVMIMLYLFYAGERRSIWPVVVLCFYHISIFTLIPLFLLHQWGLHIRSNMENFADSLVLGRDKAPNKISIYKGSEYLTNANIITTAYLVGFGITYLIQPRYVSLNYVHAIQNLHLSEAHVIPVVILLGVMYYACSFLLSRKNICGWISRFFNGKNFVWVIRVVLLITFAFTLYYIVKYSMSYSSLIRLSLPAYCILSGVFVMPVLIIILFVGKYLELSNTKKVIYISLFVWTTCIFSIVIHPSVKYYYYYGRYHMPFVALIILCFVVILKNNPKISAILIAIGCICLAPFTKVVTTYQDDTLIEWSGLEEVFSTIKGMSRDDIILMENDSAMQLYYPVRVASGAMVYPVRSRDVNEVLREIGYSGIDKRVLYITQEYETILSQDWKEIIRVNNHIEEDRALSDNRNKILGLPTKVSFSDDGTISVYELVQSTKQISGMDKEFLRGWRLPDGAGFRWGIEQTMEICPNLSEKAQIMTVKTGTPIPFEELKIDELQINVYVNNNFAATIVYNPENQAVPHTVEIDETWNKEGIDIIRFECDNMWSPSQYGVDDSRYYTISVDNITFE